MTELLLKKEDGFITKKELIELNLASARMKQLEDSKSKYFELIKLSVKKEPGSIPPNNAMDVDQHPRVHSRFSNPATILMTPAGLSDWLTGSPTSSSS
ncbi:hypothetical protein MP638_006170, partial [Amoeboaphelidium occidentale]